MNIAIVDDNKQFAETLKFYLSKHLNIESVVIYNHASQFIESLNKQSPDLVLMDIQMPDINGIEATKKGLWKHRFFKVIAVTNLHDSLYLNELLSAGFHGFVSKNRIFENLHLAIETVFNDRLYFPDLINKDL